MSGLTEGVKRRTATSHLEGKFGFLSPALFAISRRSSHNQLIVVAVRITISGAIKPSGPICETYDCSANLWCVCVCFCINKCLKSLGV